MEWTEIKENNMFNWNRMKRKWGKLLNQNGMQYNKKRIELKQKITCSSIE